MTSEMFARFDVLSAKLIAFAPVVWEKMIMLIWAESIATLCVGGIFLLLSIFSIRWIMKNHHTELRNFSGPSTKFMLMSVIAFPSVLETFTTVLYPWNWVGVFSPESRLIARLLGTLTQTVS